MKKHLLSFVAIAVLMIACAPANPPRIEKSSVIVNLCYNAMGRSGEQLKKDLAGIGIEVSELGAGSGYDETYFVRTNAYELAYSTMGDKVMLLSYRMPFGGSPMVGLNRYKDLSDLIFDYGWNHWEGSCRSSAKLISDRDEFWDLVKKDKQKNTEHHSGILEYMAKPFGEQTLWGQVHFYHMVTDKGIDVEFRIDARTWEDAQ